jgi:Zn-dependent protease with chaperone function
VAASYTAVGALGYALASLFATGEGQVPWQFATAVGAVVIACILGVSLLRLWQWRDAGPAIAFLLGARYVDPGKCALNERRLLNVVEELAIASRIAVPPVYVLDREHGVNALAAGYAPDEAVIVATAGLLTELSREELQGVIGHEFSHIVNGDMALNVRLAGLLAGLSWLGERGEASVFSVGERMRRTEPEDRGFEIFVALFGALLAFVGFPGTLAAEAIKAAIARQREFLADAAAVQFTRNADGIAGALDTLLARHLSTTVDAAYARTFSHMFFGPVVASWWKFPTHPPLEERIRRVHPGFQRADYRTRRHGTQHEIAAGRRGERGADYFLSRARIALRVSSTAPANGPPSDAARSMNGKASAARPSSESVCARLFSTMTELGSSCAARRNTASASRSSPSAWCVLARPTAALTLSGQRLRKLW